MKWYQINVTSASGYFEGNFLHNAYQKVFQTWIKDNLEKICIILQDNTYQISYI